MFNQPTKKQLNQIPKLYETEGIPTKRKTIHLHFLFGDCHWFITEFDQEDTLFGFAILNGDLEMAEWGYISFDELKSINLSGIKIQNDTEWEIREAQEVELICEAQGWRKPKTKGKIQWPTHQNSQNTTAAY
jgi:hypothetical protein